MKIHKQFIQIGITNTLLTLVVAYALYYHNFHMAFVGALMLLVSVLPVYLKAAYNIFVPAAFMYAMIIFIFI